MTLRAWLHWLLFVAYVALFFTLPPTLLWGKSGLEIGIGIALFFFVFLRFRGSQRIAQRLRVQPLTRAESPTMFTFVSEYCRRLGIPEPKTGVIESPALNAGIFGFSKFDCCFVVTRGLLDTLTREELGAVIGRELAYLRQGDFICDSWLSQFLSLLDQLASPARAKSTTHSRRYYPFRFFVRQLLLYPLTLFPAFILRVSQDPSALDLKSVKLTRHPRALGGALRVMEALEERLAFNVPFSARHLFLLTPATLDPLARVFFSEESLSPRIRAVEGLTQLVPVR